MFKISEKRIVEWPVKVSVPQDGGKVRTMDARVEFEHLPQAEFDEIYAGGGNDAELMQRVVKGWPAGQFLDEKGEEIAFSPETLDRLMQISYVRVAFVSAYLQIIQGREAARKNS